MATMLRAKYQKLAVFVAFWKCKKRKDVTPRPQLLLRRDLASNSHYLLVSASLS